MRRTLFARRPVLVSLFPAVFPLSTCDAPPALELELSREAPVVEWSRGEDPIIPYRDGDENWEEDWGEEEPRDGAEFGC